MERLLYYIAENYREDLKLADLSEAFNMNYYYYLSAYFNQEMKESFSDYLNRIRIRQACSLLEETNMPISEVGSEVGYSDHSYFCRVLKRLQEGHRQNGKATATLKKAVALRLTRYSGMDFWTHYTDCSFGYRDALCYGEYSRACYVAQCVYRNVWKITAEGV